MIRAIAKALIIGAIKAITQVNLSSKRDLSVEDAKDEGTLPPGTPIVTYSPRALAMRAEPLQIRESRIKEGKPGPRVGSYAWRVDQALQQARNVK